MSEIAGLTTLGLAEVRDAVGATAYGRGATYANQHAVVTMDWDARQATLEGRVHGRLGDFYLTTAYFGASGRRTTFQHGECSCPVGFNCKHVAALILTAVAQGRDDNPVAEAMRQDWERSLGALLGERSSASPGTDGVPLAIELTLTAGTPANQGRGYATTPTGPRLLARPLRPGKTGWVAGDVGWDRLTYNAYGLHDYRDAHVRLLRQLHAFHEARSNTSRYTYYSARTQKSIDLASFTAHELWPLLDEAAAVGLALVHGRKRLGELAPYGSGEVCLDVTSSGADGSLAVAPVLHLDTDVAAVPVLFLGADGHGLVCVDRADKEAGINPADWRVRLARLASPTSPELRRMLLDDARLAVPADATAEFRDRYCPRLGRVARLVSSDESFVPPEVSEPTLTLSAGYGEGHDLSVGLEWVYQVGDAQLRAPLGEAGADDGFRDRAAERRILADVDIPAELAASGRLELSGLDTMRFSTEVLPLLNDDDAVRVKIDGEPPDYREVGESVRIGVSTDEISGETDWFDLGITITVEESDVPFLDVFLGLARDESHLLLPDGAYFSLQKPELQALRRLIEEARLLQDVAPESLRISRFQVGLWDELTQLGVVTRQASAWERQVAALRSVDSVASVDAPTTIAAQLRPYQLDGFRWLEFLWRFRLGGILADDMGLGKTLQALALICHAKREDDAAAPFLVVAPTSVVSNWAAETERFAPGLTVATITDTERRRGATLSEAVAGADVVVTSYTLFRLEFEAYGGMSWSGLFLDEAQFAKNHQSKSYQCARRLAAPVKVAITGTPLENNLMELWSLLSITAPGLFPNPQRFQEYYARPIEKQGDTELLGQLRRRITPLLRRRTKEQVIAELPAKQEQVVEVDLHPRHRKIYQTYLQRERQKVLGLIDDMNRNRFTIFRSLTLLRQLSLHAGLVEERHDGLASAKIDALFEQLDDVVNGGHRALVFSQFTGFLERVRRQLDALGVDYCYLDGTTRNRSTVIKRFKTGTVPVFLISLKAGGFGLNLTEADYCFLLDPWWNPATEAQAVDRTHRIGQTKTVMVYRLVAKDTIEEKVMALKARKAELFANVLDDGNAFGTALAAEDIRGLFC